MAILGIDFESRSTIDLRKSGVYPYAQHPTTDIWCMAWAFDDDEPELWKRGDPVPEAIMEHVLSARGEVRAWNAQFERIMWYFILGPLYGFPKVEHEQWHCTAAEAAAMSLPRRLEQAASVLNLPTKKDMTGNALMLRMARPRSTKGGLVWWTDPARLEKLYEYCRQDVRVERAMYKRVRRLNPREREIYLLDQKINDRGVLVDVPLVKAAQSIANTGVQRANNAVAILTEGKLETVTNNREITRWLEAEGLADNVKKDTVRDLLADDEVQGVARQVLELRADTAKTSNAKMASMINSKGSDDRVRGMLMYYGADTGRWAGRLVQPQNFPRGGEVDDVQQFIPRILAHDYDAIEADEPPVVVISELLRGMFISKPGHRFLTADFSAIEARVLAWIAEQEDLVQRFASGGKVYEAMAAHIYRVHLDEIAKGSEERNMGKMTILGGGFGMGHVKFKKQLKEKSGVEITLEFAKQAIDAYRSMNDRIVSFWKEIDRAAMRAVREPGSDQFVGRHDLLRFSVRGQYLWCTLPSGRSLAYALPAIHERMTPWKEMRDAVTFMGRNSYTKKWERRHAYGGLWTENVVQAMARDLLADAMLRVEPEEYPVVLTVHDEIVAEVRNNHGTLQQFEELMSLKPRWAHDCPVAVEGWEDTRYKK